MYKSKLNELGNGYTIAYRTTGLFRRKGWFIRGLPGQSWTQHEIHLVLCQFHPLRTRWISSCVHDREIGFEGFLNYYRVTYWSLILNESIQWKLHSYSRDIVFAFSSLAPTKTPFSIVRNNPVLRRRRLKLIDWFFRF